MALSAAASLENGQEVLGEGDRLEIRRALTDAINARLQGRARMTAGSTVLGVDQDVGLTRLGLRLTSTGTSRRRDGPTIRRS